MMFNRNESSTKAASDETPPEGTKTSLSSDLARAAIVLVGPLIVSIFAGVGVSGDYVTRAVRNDPDAVKSAFFWIVVGLVLPVASLVLFAIFRPTGAHPIRDRVMLWVRVALSVAGIALVVFGSLRVANHAVDSLVMREVPVLTAVTTWPATQGGLVTVNITASASSLRAEEDFLIRVVGIRPQNEPDLTNQCTSTETVLGPSTTPDFRVLSRGNSGALTNGTAATNVVISASSSEFDYVCAYVVLRDRNRNALDDDRWAWTVIDIRQVVPAVVAP